MASEGTRTTCSGAAETGLTGPRSDNGKVAAVQPVQAAKNPLQPELCPKYRGLSKPRGRACAVPRKMMAGSAVPSLLTSTVAIIGTGLPRTAPARTSTLGEEIAEELGSQHVEEQVIYRVLQEGVTRHDEIPLVIDIPLPPILTPRKRWELPAANLALGARTPAC